jgi:hypothetical protein
VFGAAGFPESFDARLFRHAAEAVLSQPLFGILAAGFATLDFIRRPFAKTSQMFFVPKATKEAF